MDCIFYRNFCDKRECDYSDDKLCKTEEEYRLKLAQLLSSNDFKLIREIKPETLERKTISYNL